MNENRKESADSKGPLLLTVEAVAQLLQISARSIRRLVSAGRLIPPVKLGGSIRWRADEVREWINHGCPRITEWQKKKGAS